MKPTILLIHGAVHDASVWDQVIPKFEALDYPIATVQLPTSNPSSKDLTIFDDVASIHKSMLPLLDQGEEVVVVAHSYGSVPGLMSIEGNSTTERQAKSLKGGVKSVMFISSLLITEKGKSCAETHYDGANDWCEFDFEAGVVRPGPRSRDVFYNDFNDEDAKYRLAKLHPHLMSVFMTPIPYSVNDLKCTTWYLRCEKDEAVTWASQERMLGLVKIPIRVEKIATGHSPMLSKPDEFVGIVNKVASSEN